MRGRPRVATAGSAREGGASTRRSPGTSILPCVQPKSEPNFVQALCAWFEHAARDLPWRKRKHRTGYGALVAEAMLQQTQVARVVERYPAFMLRFPNARSLANALEQEVLEEWRGMGYYRRARNLHAAAQMIVRNFGGRVPSKASVLRQLPGVGRYTAGAIASIVFGKPEPIVDGNVMRVLARLYAKEGANGDAAAWTWETADRLVKLAQRSGTPGVFNEAMMELGATVCTPGRPKCETCPLQRFCAARARGLQDEFPIARKRAKPQAWVHHALVVRRGA